MKNTAFFCLLSFHLCFLFSPSFPFFNYLSFLSFFSLPYVYDFLSPLSPHRVVIYDLRFPELACLYALQSENSRTESPCTIFLHFLCRMSVCLFSWCIQHDHWSSSLGTTHSQQVSLCTSNH